MTQSTGSVSFRADGTGQVDACLRLTGNSYVLCCTYDDRPPILSVSDARVSVTVSVPDADTVTPDDLATARRLADAVTRYVTELERHVPALPAEHDAAA
jgi:hypothetical protein